MSLHATATAIGSVHPTPIPSLPVGIKLAVGYSTNAMMFRADIPVDADMVKVTEQLVAPVIRQIYRQLTEWQALVEPLLPTQHLEGVEQ